MAAARILARRLSSGHEDDDEEEEEDVDLLLKLGVAGSPVKGKGHEDDKEDGPQQDTRHPVTELDPEVGAGTIIEAAGLGYGLVRGIGVPGLGKGVGGRRTTAASRDLDFDDDSTGGSPKKPLLASTPSKRAQQPMLPRPLVTDPDDLDDPDVDVADVERAISQGAVTALPAMVMESGADHSLSARGTESATATHVSNMLGVSDGQRGRHTLKGWTSGEMAMADRKSSRMIAPLSNKTAATAWTADSQTIGGTATIDSEVLVSPTGFPPPAVVVAGSHGIAHVLRSAQASAEEVQITAQQMKQTLIRCTFDQVPPARVKECRAMFKFLDEDGSGSISSAELADSFINMGIPATRPELESMIQEMDADKSGEIDFEEFTVMVHSLYLRSLTGAFVIGGKEYVDGSKSPQEVSKFIKFQAAVWTFLDDPGSSRWASLWSMLIMATILMSCIAFVMETTSYFHRQYDDQFGIVESVSISIFTTELVLRVLTCPNRGEWLRSPLTIIDMIAVLPFYLELLAADLHLSGSPVFRVVRLVRVIRLFKLSRYMSWLGLFQAAMERSLAPLLMILFVLCVEMTVLCSVAYFLERGDWNDQLQEYVNESGEPSPFQSIPAAFWWCIITMLTIGYGDMVPVTDGGKLCGAVAAMSGVLILAVPISVISANFHTEYFNLLKAKEIRQLQETKFAASGQSKDEFGPEQHAEYIHSITELVSENSKLHLYNLKAYEGHNRHSLAQSLTEAVSHMSGLVAYSVLDQLPRVAAERAAEFGYDTLHVSEVQAALGANRSFIARLLGMGLDERRRGIRQITRIPTPRNSSVRTRPMRIR